MNTQLNNTDRLNRAALPTIAFAALVTGLMIFLMMSLSLSFRRLSIALAVIATGLLALTLSLGSATAAYHEKKGSDRNIVSAAVAASNFNTPVTAVEVAGLVETLESDNHFTVFATTNETSAIRIRESSPRSMETVSGYTPHSDGNTAKVLYA